LELFFLFQEASAQLSGAGVFGKLKYESGVHRVQVDLCVAFLHIPLLPVI
jgi:hypothetical protein